MPFLRLSCILALAIGASASFYTEDKAEQLYMWEAYKEEYNRDYSTVEDLKRFEIFNSNMKIVDQRNLEDTALHGITQFSDLSPDEFAAMYLTEVEEFEDFELDGNFSYIPDDTEAPAVGSTSKADWTGKYTTPIKDQKSCGSCFAFAVTEQLESDYMRAGHHSKVLSPQQVLDCGSGSCNGGSSTTEMKYLQGGQELESDYPYKGKQGSCKSDKSKYKVKSTGYSNVKGESSMASYTGKTGTLKLSVDASNWSSYKSGIMSHKSCGTSTDHAVQAVGIDTGAGYWKVRNSWGTSFGESGYIRLEYGENTCGLANKGGYYMHAEAY